MEKQKRIDYFEFNYNSVAGDPSTDKFTFTVDSRISCSKIRINIVGTLLEETNIDALPLLAYSNIVNSYIGTLETNFTSFTVDSSLLYKDNLKPINALTFYYPNKFYLAGTYDLVLTRLDGSSPNGTVSNLVSLVIEYFE